MSPCRMRLMSCAWQPSRPVIVCADSTRGRRRASSSTPSRSRIALPAARTSPWSKSWTSRSPYARSTICIPGCTVVALSAASVSWLMAIPGAISMNSAACPSSGMNPCDTVCRNPVSCGCRMSRYVNVRSSIIASPARSGSELQVARLCLAPGSLRSSPPPAGSWPATLAGVGRGVNEAGQPPQVPHLVGLEPSLLAHLQAEIRDPPERHALELQHLQVQRLGHAVDLARSPLADRHHQPGVRPGELEHIHLRRRGAARVVAAAAVAVSLRAEAHARAELLHLGGRDLAADLHVVRLGYVAPGREQARLQLAVVREQEHALAVEVEPPHGDDARGQILRQELHHGVPPLRIRHRAHVALGLVQDEIDEVLAEDELAVDTHLVPGRVDLGAE